MPDTEIPVIQDGYVGYAGGVHAASTNPREMGENQCSLLVNSTVRGGFLGCRDGYAHLDLEFSSGYDRDIFERGVFQGEERYSSGTRDVVAYVISGHLFTVDPERLKVTRHSVPGKRQPLSKTAPFAFMRERDGYLVVQDGVNRPVILEGSTARKASLEDSEVPIGTIMADGWGRLALVGIDRRRISFSDHELDPESSSLKFTEQNEYYLAARYFQPPRRLGQIMAAEFIPFVDAPAGFGPLIVFGTNAAVTYDVSYPRVDGGWVKNNIERLTLLNIGACSHRATVAADNDLIFRDQFGRIRTLSQTVREQEARKSAQRVQRFDREVSPWIAREDPQLRQWLDAASYGDRYLFTALPELVGAAGHVVPRGTLAYNLDTLANLRGTEEPAWDGLWTGLGYQAMTAALFNGAPRLFILSMDRDGRRRVYEQRRGQTHDVVDGQSKAIERQVCTRWLDFKAPMLLKRLRQAVLRMSDIQGKISIEGYVRRTESENWVPWFSHRHGADACLKFDPACGCQPLAADATTIERLVLPALPVAQESFYRMQVMLVITGWGELCEFVLDATPTGQDSMTQSTRCGSVETAATHDLTPWDDLRYSVT